MSISVVWNLDTILRRFFKILSMVCCFCFIVINLRSFEDVGKKISLTSKFTPSWRISLEIIFVSLLRIYFVSPVLYSNPLVLNCWNLFFGLREFQKRFYSRNKIYFSLYLWSDCIFFFSKIQIITMIFLSNYLVDEVMGLKLEGKNWNWFERKFTLKSEPIRVYLAHRALLKLLRKVRHFEEWFEACFVVAA